MPPSDAFATKLSRQGRLCRQAVNVEVSVPEHPPSLVTARADHSRFVQRIRRRYSAEALLLAPGLPGADSMAQTLSALNARGHALPAALRVLRQLVLERLATLDIEAQASMGDVTQTMTTLAEMALEAALQAAELEAEQRHGPPLNAQGQRVALWIVGMGKLGARELNVSSDIDLVYVYEEDGHTVGGAGGRHALSFHEYFSFLAKRLFTLIGETTEDGFVFRMDLALRPNGNSGPRWSAWRCSKPISRPRAASGNVLPG